MLLLELVGQQLTPQTFSGKGYIHGQTLQVIDTDYHLPHIVAIAKHGRQMGIDPKWLEKNVPSDPARIVFWAEDNDKFFGPIQNQAYAHHWIRFVNFLRSGGRSEINLTGVVSDLQDLIVSTQFGAIVNKFANAEHPLHINIDYVETIDGKRGSFGRFITTLVEFNQLKREFAPNKIIESKRIAV